jgi:primosomal replication protein N
VSLHRNVHTGSQIASRGFSDAAEHTATATTEVLAVHGEDIEDQSVTERASEKYAATRALISQ